MKTIRNIIFFSTLSFLFILTGCEEEPIVGNGNIVEDSRDVDPFDGIDISEAFDVELTQGNVPAVTIITDENVMPFVEVSIINGELKIRFSPDAAIESTTELRAVISFETLRSLELSGSTRLIGTNIFQLDDIDIRCSGTCTLDMEFDADDVDIDVSGTCDLALFGNADDVTMRLSGASTYNAYDFIANSYDVRLSGACRAKIHVLESLEVDASGSCSMIFKGDPAHLDIDISGDCTVEHF